MKSMFNALLAATAALALSASAHAKALPFFFGEYTSCKKVMDLPDDENHKINGDYADFGELHTTYHVVFLPVYATEPEWCLPISDTHYYPIKDMALVLRLVRDEFPAADIPDKPKLSFWDAWGGRIALLILIGAVVAWMARSENQSSQSQGA